MRIAQEIEFGDGLTALHVTVAAAESPRRISRRATSMSTIKFMSSDSGAHADGRAQRDGALGGITVLSE